MDDVSSAARSRGRDRRGRGMRGPGVLPAVPGTPALRTARQRFDQLVLDVVTPLDEQWQRHLGLVEYAVEDAPMLPDDWGDDTVPLSSLVRGKGQAPTRLVIFRRPIEHRATTTTSWRRWCTPSSSSSWPSCSTSARGRSTRGTSTSGTAALALGRTDVGHLAGRLQLGQRQHREAAVADLEGHDRTGAVEPDERRAPPRRAAGAGPRSPGRARPGAPSRRRSRPRPRPGG